MGILNILRYPHVNIGGYVAPLTSNDNVHYLKAIGGAANETLHNVTTGNDYQVPAGKRARIIYIDSFASDAADEGIVYDDDPDTADAGSTFIYENATVLTEQIFISQWVPELKYINKKDSTAGKIYTCYIHEASA